MTGAVPGGWRLWITARGGPPVPSPVIQTQGPSRDNCPEAHCPEVQCRGSSAVLVCQHRCQKRDGPGLANRGRRRTWRCTEQALVPGQFKLGNQVRDSCPEVQCPVS